MSSNLNELKQLFNILAKDAESIIGNSKRNISQTKRRTLLRAIFAMIEVDIFTKKRICLDRYQKQLVKFTNGELALLKEEQYDIDSKGNLKIKTKYLRLADNYLFAINCFCKAYGLKFNIDTRSKFWQSFLKSIEIRNRITHPKSLESIFISDSEIKLINLSHGWLGSITEDLINQLDKKYPK